VNAFKIYLKPHAFTDGFCCSIFAEVEAIKANDMHSKEREKKLTVL